MKNYRLAHPKKPKPKPDPQPTSPVEKLSIPPKPKVEEPKVEESKVEEPKIKEPKWRLYSDLR
jgi:hypothetical protein